MITAVTLVVAGLVAGALAAALGIGGGVVFVPVLALVLGLDQAVAQGTSLAVMVPTALIGTYGHARYRRVEWNAVVPVAAGGILGAVLGAQAALAAEPLLLRRMFALLLVVLAVRMISVQLRDRAGSRRSER